MAAEAGLDRTGRDSLPDPFRRPPPGQAPPLRGARRGSGSRVVTVKLLLFGVAEVCIAARLRHPVEALVAPVGEPVAGEGRPVPMTEPPPQDAREGREKAPEGRSGPDGPQDGGDRSRPRERGSWRGGREQVPPGRGPGRIGMGSGCSWVAPPGIRVREVRAADRPLRPGSRTPSRPASASRRRGARLAAKKSHTPRAAVRTGGARKRRKRCFRPIENP